MIVILCAVMLMQALSLPPLHKRYDVLNPSNHFYRPTHLIELDPRKPSDYRIIIEASSTKVKQCFYYINLDDKLQRVCRSQTDKVIKENKLRKKEKKELIKDKPIEKIKNFAELIDVTKELTGQLKSELKVDIKDNYVAVDILATAGMRKKTITEQTKIWSDFIEVWENKQNDKLLQLNTIQDTSGVEEGIYGCMIANVALGHLDLSLNSPKKADDINMVGIVEIGGASAQIAVPIKKGTNFNDFKNFQSRSIPFGKDWFLEYVMEKEVPKSCRYPVNFDLCCVVVSGKIHTKVNSEKHIGNWNLPKEILESSHYYLLGGYWGHAWEPKKIKENIQRQWDAKKIEKNTKMTKESFYNDDQTVNIAVLEDWTKAMCFHGPTWQKQSEKNSFPEMACYTSVYAYSFLKHFLKDKEFYIDKPLSNSYIVKNDDVDLLSGPPLSNSYIVKNDDVDLPSGAPLSNSYIVKNDDVDWPSGAYLYLKSHAYDLPSTEVSVTVIKDDQYEEENK